MTFKVFRDAVHNMISLHRETDGPAQDPLDWGDALLLALIDTPEVQRLRRIRQLGPANRVYPSAEHSRFSHALGTLHLAKRIIATLLARAEAPLDRQVVLQIKVAALLHDIGHGPYSHVFELIAPALVQHEQLGWQLVARQGEIRRVITEHCARLRLAVEPFYRGLQGLLAGKEEGDVLPFGRQLISSQLDADRMDYLLRDAHFTGVSYGRYDLEWLLHSLRAFPVGQEYQLGVEVSKGPSALESYIVARDHMYRQVYDHKTVRAFEVLLVHLFQVLLWYRQERGHWPPGTPWPLDCFLQSLLSGSTLHLPEYLALDDAVLECAIGLWARQEADSPAAAELCWKCQLLRDRQPVYRRIRWHWRGGEEWCSDQLHDRELADHVELFFQQERQRLLEVEDARGRRWQVPLSLLVRVDRLERAPYAHLQYMAGKVEPIWTVMEGDRQGLVRPAEQVSPLIDQLGGSRRRVARVFVDPRALSAVEGLLRERFVHAHLAVA
ncbi:HD domain-containing protein [Candidatus Magnetaquicoccus inordinatus]|uniref:HD domain-containing protein n=1 Tax=Candidatus Magnetaquicoccus inordinatus TaxID=2496818 RepID=UPI00102BF6E7|nr:HD domain-containing protein [Candidatus Magnetaquicoccus inordinatus]